jgi:hypothetical protein
VTTTPVCEQDGFPLVEIGGDWYCSAEYTDGLVGGREITGLREDDGYILLDFDNGGAIPLTCTCCGGQIHLRAVSLDTLERMLMGRRLEGFQHGEYVGRGAPAARHPIFALIFSGDEDVAARTVQVHLESVRRLTPPPDAPQRPPLPLWN